MIFKSNPTPEALIIALAAYLTDRNQPGDKRDASLREFFQGYGPKTFPSTPELAIASLRGVLDELAPGLGEAARKTLFENVPLDMALFSCEVGRSPEEALKPIYLEKLDRQLLKGLQNG
jgi:hypothetical protein